MSTRILYKITSKKIIEIINEEYKEKKKVMRKIRTFANKHGLCTDTLQTWARDGGWSLRELYAKKGVVMDKKLWKFKDGWSPKSNSKEGRELMKEWNTFEWFPTKFAEAVGWKDIMHDCHYYTFNPFGKPKEDLWGFAAPVVPKEHLYKPIRGVKEVKPSWYAKQFED